MKSRQGYFCAQIEFQRVRHRSFRVPSSAGLDNRSIRKREAQYPILPGIKTFDGNTSNNRIRMFQYPALGISRIDSLTQQVIRYPRGKRSKGRVDNPWQRTEERERDRDSKGVSGLSYTTAWPGPILQRFLTAGMRKTQHSTCTSEGSSTGQQAAGARIGD